MRLVLLACLMEVLFLRLLFLGDLKQHLVETILTLLLAGLVYVVSCYSILREPGRRVSLILAAGLLFRLTVWPLYPALTGDLYRYRWEGKLQQAGGNPYASRPGDTEWQRLQDSTYPLVGGKTIKAVYGPLIQLVERGTYVFVSSFEQDPMRQVFWFKLPSAVFDVAAMVVLWLLLLARGSPPERVLIYAWSPLPVIAFWATGHNDSLTVLFILLALLAGARRLWTWAFAALTLAVAAKIWPILLFPLFIGWERGRPRRPYQWWVSIPILLILCLPYWTELSENIRYLGGFMGDWRNNDSLFGLLLWMGRDAYHAKLLSMGIVLASMIVLTLRRACLEWSVLVLLVVTLLVSANCHPWYLTWFIPLLAFYPAPALLLWTALMPLTYVAVIPWVTLGEWDGNTSLRWLVYVPVFGMMATHLLTSWRRVPALSWRRAADTD